MRLLAIQRDLWRTGLGDWIKAPRHAADLWLGRYSIWAAWLGLALALISPPDGMKGIELCLLHASTGISCPGCGLTRSLSCALRGMCFESWNYHPFGLFILALFILTAMQSLLPRNSRGRIAEYIQMRAVIFNSLYLVFVTSFVGYGTMRSLVHLAATI